MQSLYISRRSFLSLQLSCRGSENLRTPTQQVASSKSGSYSNHLIWNSTMIVRRQIWASPCVPRVFQPLASSRLAAYMQSWLHFHPSFSVSQSRNYNSKHNEVHRKASTPKIGRKVTSSTSSTAYLQDVSSYSHLWEKDDDTNSAISYQKSPSSPSTRILPPNPPSSPIASFDHRTFPVPVGATPSRRGERQGRFKLFQLPRMTPYALLRHRYGTRKIFNLCPLRYYIPPINLIADPLA